MARGDIARVLLVAAAACLLFAGPAQAAKKRYFNNDMVTPCSVFSRTSESKDSKEAFDSHLSRFGVLLDKFLDYGELFQTTWCGSGGGSRYTIIAPSNAGLVAGLKRLTGRYGTTANVSALEYNGNGGSPFDYSDKLREAFLGIADFHFIPTPVNFYSNSKVLKATKKNPLKLPATYAFKNPNAHLSVYTEKGVVYVAPSGGGLLGGPAHAIHRTHTTLGAFEKGDNSLIYIYTIDGLLVPNRVIDQKKVKPNGQRTSTISLPTLLKAVGYCKTAYFEGYGGSRAKGCSKNN